LGFWGFGVLGFWGHEIGGVVVDAVEGEEGEGEETRELID